MYILKTGEAQPLYLDEYLLAYRVKKNRHGMKPERKLELKSDSPDQGMQESFKINRDPQIKRKKNHRPRPKLGMVGDSATGREY